MLRVAYASDPGSLDPLIAIDQDVIALNLFYCQTLVGLSADNRVVPILVTRVPSRQNGDISPNGTTITYHLCPEARFADGVPLTSADVAFTYRAIVDPRNRATSVQPYRRIASSRTPDAHTVVIHLRQPGMPQRVCCSRKPTMRTGSRLNTRFEIRRSSARRGKMHRSAPGHFASASGKEAIGSSLNQIAISAATETVANHIRNCSESQFEFRCFAIGRR
ncbi:MAG: ABC transporter substrate-binding protein [Vulcanimicrobiaceae bacterium]